MRFVDIYPSKGMFRPGDEIEFQIEIDSRSECGSSIRLSVFQLLSCILSETHRISLGDGLQKLTIKFTVPPIVPRGYGVQADLLSEDGEVLDSRFSAFDVMEDWVNFPRYGFLCDFYTDRTDITETIESLVRYHINGIQFYDWQYRHDQLIPPSREYLDPLSRNLSLDTVEKLISTSHSKGIGAMPYLAVYAASLEFWQQHQDWGLYDENGVPLTFEGFLGLMDPTQGTPWIEHLLEQCDLVLKRFPFDGLHVDQYGDPKVGFNSNGERVDIPKAFHDFISTLRKRYPSANLVFNAVGNWPIESLATSPEDFVYIEVWPPDIRYTDLFNIVSYARKVSCGKPVVVALYLPVDHHTNIRLVDALLFAFGATRIEIGENERLLTDPYFPKHEQITPDLISVLRSYYDFVIRYSDLLGPAVDKEFDLLVEAPESVLVVPRIQSEWIVVNLINFSELIDPRWDKSHEHPTLLNNLVLKISGQINVMNVWWASPDLDSPEFRPLDWIVEEDVIHLKVPYLYYWTMVVIQTGEELNND